MDNDAIDKLASVVLQLDMTADRLSQQLDRQQPSASAGNVTIHAGGITSAVALVLALTAIVVAGVGWVASELKLAAMADQQGAWIQVWTSKVNEKAKE